MATATLSASISSALTKKYKGCICRDCTRVIGESYGGQQLHLGAPPVLERSKFATCQPCADQTVCAGGCEGREIPDGIKLVPSSIGPSCRNCLSRLQRLRRTF